MSSTGTGTSYASAIEARARDGIESHGSLRAYIRDFRASSKLFEYVAAMMQSRKHGRAFYLWEDVALVVKDALGLPHPDVGIDITDTTRTIVQCKLRSNTLTWDGHRNLFGLRPRPSRQGRKRNRDGNGRRVVRGMVGGRRREERVLASERARRLLRKQAWVRRADYARGRRVYRLRDPASVCAGFDATIREGVSRAIISPKIFFRNGEMITKDKVARAQSIVKLALEQTVPSSLGATYSQYIAAFVFDSDAAAGRGSSFGGVELYTVP